MNNYFPSSYMAGDIKYLSHIKFQEKSNEEFYHLKCYMIRDAYHLFFATYGLVRVQGVGEDTPNNMSLLSILNHWNFTKRTSWPSKP